jgi:peptidoglycan/LPS O-acetylase OafA/YrhL
VTVTTNQVLEPAGENEKLARPTLRLHAIDSIRYICALWVVVNHSYDATHVAGTHGLISLMESVIGAVFSGPAAVIVFFVISGLCIHFPYRYTEHIGLGSYYARRYIRIGLPLVAAVLIEQLCAGHKPHLVSLHFLASGSVYWSLLAEAVYYGLYPLLILIQRKVGWNVLISFSYLAALGVLVSHLHMVGIGGYPLFGAKYTWILGLPCWLLGCRIADMISADGQPEGQIQVNAKEIWLWRSAVLAASCGAKFMQFHIRPHIFFVGYSCTLDLFAVLVYWWLIREIEFARVHRPLRWLEAAGVTSYSLYLTHPIVIGLLSKANIMRGALLPLDMALIVLGSLIFFFLVELPSHKLARLFKPKKAQIVPG